MDLPNTDISGCLRCLEVQAHLLYGGFDVVPPDLAGIGGRRQALRSVAEAFGQHIKAARNGRAALPRGKNAQRWTDRPDDAARSTAKAGLRGPANSATRRWPKRPPAAKRDVKARRFELRAKHRRAAPRSPSPAAILGLSGSPSRTEIIAAFRRLALLHHPDYGGNADTFRALVTARNALLGDE